MTTLSEKLTAAGLLTPVLADDISTINQVLSETGMEVSLDMVGTLDELEIYAGYYSEKLRKLVHLGEIGDLYNIEKLAESLENYEREAKDLEESITLRFFNK